MRPSEVEWVLARQPTKPRLFPYFKDRYALLLLSWAAAGGAGVRALKKSRLGPLFDKPIVRSLLARERGSLPPAAELRDYDVDDSERYQVTLGTWGCDDERKWRPAMFQTTRPGKNIVLQLNFPRSHRPAYWGLVAPPVADGAPAEHPWVSPGHPVSTCAVTLAWARVDVAFDSSEALIEEIQSDWVRAARAEANHLSKLDATALSQAELYGFAPGIGVYHVLSYVEHVLGAHAELWAEATLAAALSFVRDELGIRRIFYNTFETGVFLKDIVYGRPPRSLYTDLPRRFCFQKTSERPRALGRCRHPIVRQKLARPNLEWFLLEL
jgi:hypothetical protein